MSIRERRREAAVEAMADHLLAVGLKGGSVRALAAAAGVSDRMLLYYFADKDEMLGEALAKVAARLQQALDAALPAGVRLPYTQLLGAVWAASGSPDLQPFMHLWLDLAAGSARHEEPQRTIAGAIAEGFHTWAVGHLEGDDEAARRRLGAMLLATVEGMLLLDALGRRDLADAAAELATRP